jgi:hypothetical protein
MVGFAVINLLSIFIKFKAKYGGKLTLLNQCPNWNFLFI